MLDALTAVVGGPSSARASTAVPSTPALRAPRPQRFHPTAAAPSAPAASDTTPERQTEMQLLHEALARAQCSDRYASAEAQRLRQRHLKAARAHRRLEIAVRKAERAAREAERRDALCEASV